MKKYLAEHWFNLGTLFVSAVALVIAFHGNEIFFNASTSKMDIFSSRSWSDEGDIFITGCYSGMLSPHELTRNMFEMFTFMNKGGRAVSLIRFSFSEGTIDYDDITVSELGTEGVQNEREVTLPLDIDGGKGRTWFFRAKYKSSYASVQDALNAINYPEPRTSNFPETQKPSRWKFEFSDGEILNYEYKTGWYHPSANIFYDLERPCALNDLVPK